MSKTTYNIQLKGYVGGWDFDRTDVDDMLAQNEGKPVNVLIDSLGGSLATGLSISAAFKNHGDVSVHFVGLNASAATIASLGAKHISIDAGAMYLVHKCSMSFFEWGSLNSDQFSTLIADCEKIKADLDKLDLNVASLYAARCKRKPEDLLALMKVGGWLSAKEALDWGFVDEITDLADEPAPKLTDALASAMASEGMPIPNIPISEADKETAFGKFLAAIASLFKANTPTNLIPIAMNKAYQFLCAVLGLSALALTEGNASLTDEQLVKIDNALKEKEDALAAKDATIAAHEKTVSDQKAVIDARDATIADLQAKLDAKPGAASNQVVESGKPSDNSADKSDAEIYCDTVNSAKKLFASV